MYDDDTVAGSWASLADRLNGEVLGGWFAIDAQLAELRSCEQLADVVEGPDSALSDRLLRTLTQVAAAESPHAGDALLLTLHILSAPAKALASSLWDLSHQALGLVVGEMACQIRVDHHRGWGGHCAANLVLQTRREVLAELRPWVRNHRELGESVTTDGATGLFDRPVPGPLDEPGLDVIDLLAWAIRSGIDAADVRLLIATEHARDRLPSTQADGLVASRYGLSTRTLYRRRTRTLAQVRAIAPAYLAAVA